MIEDIRFAIAYRILYLVVSILPKTSSGLALIHYIHAGIKESA